MNLMKIYDQLPCFLQNVACTLVGFNVKNRKYGRRFRKVLNDFLERDKWSYAQLCEYRDQQLQKIVAHCYEHVPYYRRLFDSLGIDYRQIRGLDDLSVLPILTKSMVLNNFDQFLADNIKDSERMLMHTSGTSGSCFYFYYTKSAYAAQWADKKRYDYHINVTGHEWNAYFGGRSIVPKQDHNPPFYRINYAMKEVLFSSFHLCSKNFPNYLEGFEKFKPECWHGYPSSFQALAQYMLDTNQYLSFVPKVIFLSSENVTKESLDKMEAAFGVRPIQGYALTEQVATFRQYLDGRMLVMEDLSAVEFIPVNNTDLCKVIGTTLTNYAMPLLRYDTNDLVSYKETESGREILSIEGRLEDDIKLPNGGTIRRLSRIFHNQPNILEAQIVQKNMECVEFHIVRGAHFCQEDFKRLEKEIAEFLAGHIGWKIVYDDAVPRTNNGKVKFIVSEL